MTTLDLVNEIESALELFPRTDDSLTDDPLQTVVKQRQYRRMAKTRGLKGPYQCWINSLSFFFFHLMLLKHFSLLSGISIVVLFESNPVC